MCAEPIKKKKKQSTGNKMNDFMVPVANVLEDPQVLWTAQGLHWGLTVSFSDYHLQDYCLKIQ